MGFWLLPNRLIYDSSAFDSSSSMIAFLWMTSSESNRRKHLLLSLMLKTHDVMNVWLLLSFVFDYLQRVNGDGGMRFKVRGNFLFIQQGGILYPGFLMLNMLSQLWDLVYQYIGMSLVSCELKLWTCSRTIEREYYIERHIKRVIFEIIW